MTLQKPKKSYLWLWFLWLVAFYLTWLWLVLGLGHWGDTKEHWPIALAMALGSYVAGSTPMGGGTVGFPVLVLGFDMPASLGRDFSFAVQSIGMTSASILILARRLPLAWLTLKGATVGIFLGTTDRHLRYLASHIRCMDQSRVRGDMGQFWCAAFLSNK